MSLSLGRGGAPSCDELNNVIVLDMNPFQNISRKNQGDLEVGSKLVIQTVGMRQLRADPQLTRICAAAKR
jgi:hypothetical protein